MMAMKSVHDADVPLFQLCRLVYQEVLTKVYEEKRPRASIDKLLADDTYRYEELPASVVRLSGISKEQLTRLVQWKITHGINRPFLPSMVQKNTDSEVKEHTESATQQLKLSWQQADSEIIQVVMKALDLICKLKGVGPATGSLVLSVIKPDIVPFFEDELFAWLCPEHMSKLKYDKKEYRMLLERALKVMRKQQVLSFDLEQAAFVLMNAKHLTEAQKAQISSSEGSERIHIDLADNCSLQQAVERPKNTKKATTLKGESSAIKSKGVSRARSPVEIRRSKRRRIEDQKDG